MSYVNRKSGNSRSATIVAVAALHLAAIWALINGLGIDYVKETVFNLPSRNIPAPTLEPQPAPEPAKAEPRNTDRVDVVEPVVPIVPQPGDFVVNLPPIADTLPPVTPGDLLPPDTRPLFKPVAPRVIGSPAEWATTNDYPTRDIRQGNEGRASFLLSIDANGRVTGCRITQSSGFDSLDAATCLHVSRRARFEPARNERGERVSGSYAGAIRWVIPR